MNLGIRQGRQAPTWAFASSSAALILEYFDYPSQELLFLKNVCSTLKNKQRQTYTDNEKTYCPSATKVNRLSKPTLPCVDVRLPLRGSTLLEPDFMLPSLCGAPRCLVCAFTGPLGAQFNQGVLCREHAERRRRRKETGGDENEGGRRRGEKISTTTQQQQQQQHKNKISQYNNLIIILLIIILFIIIIYYY